MHFSTKVVEIDFKSDETGRQLILILPARWLWDGMLKKLCTTYMHRMRWNESPALLREGVLREKYNYRYKLGLHSATLARTLSSLCQINMYAPPFLIISILRPIESPKVDDHINRVFHYSTNKPRATSFL